MLFRSILIAQYLKIADDLNREINFSKPPERIISLAPNITEIIFKLNSGDKIIGNTTYCTFPKEAEEISKVGDLVSADFEKIISLNPDLIFVTVEGNSKAVFEKLISLGFNIFVSNPRNFDGIIKTTSDISLILSKKEIADSLIEEWIAKLNSVSKNNKTSKGVIFVSLKPLMAAGSNSFLNEYLVYNNLENIYSEAKANYPLVSIEELISANPDYIFHSDSANNFYELFPELGKIKAVKEKQIYYIDPDLYFRPGPRFIEALSEMKTYIK